MDRVRYAGCVLEHRGHAGGSRPLFPARLAAGRALPQGGLAPVAGQGTVSGSQLPM
jgi:hypothetical protein